MRRIIGLLILSVLIAAPLGAQEKIKEKDLPSPYQDFLTLTRYIIKDKELDVFLQLQNNRERDAFIEMFWKIRDPTPGTPQNEYQEETSPPVQPGQHLLRKKFGPSRLDDGSGKILHYSWGTGQCRAFRNDNRHLSRRGLVLLWEMSPRGFHLILSLSSGKKGGSGTGGSMIPSRMGRVRS